MWQLLNSTVYVINLKQFADHKTEQLRNQFGRQTFTLISLTKGYPKNARHVFQN